MAHFEWNEAYSVNIQEIDNQHRRLVELLNELYDGILNGTNALGAAQDVLADLVAYAEEHFATEEKLMEEYEFPGYEEHRSKHDAIKVRITGYVQRIKTGKPMVAIELARYLEGWLGKHICETDMLYSAYLTSRGVV